MAQITHNKIATDSFLRRHANKGLALLLLMSVIGLIEFISRYPRPTQRVINPELHPIKTINYAPPAVKVISVGKSSQVAVGDVPFVYRPKEGESINDIAIVFGLDPQEIATANELTIDHGLPLPTNRLIKFHFPSVF